jgi:HEPN domain-containing protein
MKEPLEDEYYDLFEILSTLYLSSRYPDFQTHLENTTKEDKAREIYLKTREVFTWLQTLKP